MHSVDLEFKASYYDLAEDVIMNGIYRLGEDRNVDYVIMSNAGGDSFIFKCDNEDISTKAVVMAYMNDEDDFIGIGKNIQMEGNDFSGFSFELPSKYSPNWMPTIVLTKVTIKNDVTGEVTEMTPYDFLKKVELPEE